MTAAASAVDTAAHQTPKRTRAERNSAAKRCTPTDRDTKGHTEARNDPYRSERLRHRRPQVTDTRAGTRAATENQDPESGLVRTPATDMTPGTPRD